MRSPAFALSVVALILPRADAAVPTFDVTLLPELAGSTSVAAGVDFDAAGTPVPAGRSTKSAGTQQAVVWDLTGTPSATPLILLDPSMDGWANDVVRCASAGSTVVVGASLDPAGKRKPVMWRKADQDPSFGSPITLPVLLSGEGEAIDGGCGNDYFTAGTSTTGTGVEKAVVWTETSPGSFAVTTLPHYAAGLAGGATCSIIGLVNFLAGGWAENAQGDTIPNTWFNPDPTDSWTRTPLPLLAGGTQGKVNGMLIIFLTARVQAVGWSEVTGGNRHAALWESTDDGQTWSVADLGTLPGLPQSEGYVGSDDDIFRPPVILGKCYGGPGTGRATIWLDEGQGLAPQDLNDLLSGTPSLVLQSALAVGVDPQGRLAITGFGTDVVPGPARAAASPHAFLLRETPATGIEVPAVAAAAELSLSASPNPFAGGTTVEFALPSAGPASVALYDVLGRRVAVLAEGERSAGAHSVRWDGRDATGRPAAPGVYLVRLESVAGVRTQRVARVR